MFPYFALIIAWFLFKIIKNAKFRFNLIGKTNERNIQ